jgi:hypothetical protein
MVIDNPISFAEVNRAINKLKKGKAPGLNGIPPDRSKQWTTSHDKQFTVTYATSLRVKLIIKGGIKANVSQCLSKVT